MVAFANMVAERHVGEFPIAFWVTVAMATLLRVRKIPVPTMTVERLKEELVELGEAGAHAGLVIAELSKMALLERERLDKEKKKQAEEAPPARE